MQSLSEARSSGPCAAAYFCANAEASRAMSSRPLAQRRHANRENVQPVEQILAEFALADRLRRGRGWWRRSRARRPCASASCPPARIRPPAARAAASSADRRGSSPTSSRKIVPPSASAKRPSRLLRRAGERARLVAEELALDERGRNRRAVDLDERLVPAPAGGVDRPGDQLLAGAGFAQDQHRRVGAGHLLHVV